MHNLDKAHHYFNSKGIERFSSLNLGPRNLNSSSVSQPTRGRPASPALVYYFATF
jgi:hypothetical protein